MKKAEDIMHTYFDTILGQHVELDAPRRTVKKAATPKAAVDEREALIAAYIDQHPAETRTAAASAIYSAHPGLYERCRLEEVVSTHGGTLLANRGTASFGVDSHGNTITKSVEDVTAEIYRKAALVVQKSTTAVTLDAAVSAVLRADRDLYDRFRRASYV
jgi:hypothetical protein